MFQILYIRKQQRKSVHNKYKVIIKVFLITFWFRNLITGKHIVRIEMAEIGRGPHPKAAQMLALLKLQVVRTVSMYKKKVMCHNCILLKNSQQS
jgi:hypothetical protein